MKESRPKTLISGINQNINARARSQWQGKPQALLAKSRKWHPRKEDNIYREAVAKVGYIEEPVDRVSPRELELITRALKEGWAYPQASYEDVEYSAIRQGVWAYWKIYHAGPYRITPMEIDEEKGTLLEVVFGDYDDMTYIWAPDKW